MSMKIFVNNQTNIKAMNTNLCVVGEYSPGAMIVYKNFNHPPYKVLTYLREFGH